MTFHLRSLSARRYRIEGDLPPVHDPEFARRLFDRRFQPLSPHEERGVGWVTVDNCLDTEITTESIARGPCATFALRVDRRRVSGRLLRARLDLEWRGRRKDAAAAGEGARAGRGKRGGREERQEMRRALTEELLRSTPPSLDVHPVLLYPRDKVVLFQCLSRPANDAFRALFLDTFEVGLAALTPYHRALELLSGHGGGEALAPIRRAEFGRASAALPAPEGAPGRRHGVPATAPEVSS